MESTEQEGPKLVRFLPDSGTLLAEMESLMTAAAEGDEVLFGVVPESASWMDVVNLEVCAPTAVLAAPPVARQDLLAQLTIGLRVEAEPGLAQDRTSHEAFLSCSKNCFCCGGGRN